jgi:hypothetical protein
MMILAAAALLPAQVKVPRAALQEIETGFDKTIREMDINAPYEILGLTRGVYLDGYGVVFTAEANLVAMGLSPFHREPDKAAIAKLNTTKKRRLITLKAAMRQTLMAAGAKLTGVPPGEQVVLAVNLFYRSYEQREGLPDQVIMQATRQALSDKLESSIRVMER